MNILLLGHTGFVGKNVARIFEKSSITFTGASLSTGIDLRKIEDATKIIKQTQPDFIINCAAQVGSLNYVTEQAAEVITNNSQMILSMYQAVAKTSPRSIIINPLANCAYPAQADTFVEDNWWNGNLHRSVLAYGSTRKLLWAVGESYDMQYGIRSIHLHVPNMYGPYDSTDPNKAHALNALTAKFVKAKMSKENKIEIWGTGIAIREWLYAEDFGKVMAHIIKNKNMVGLSEPVNIGQNFGLSVRELVEIIKTTTGFSGQITWDHSKPDGAPRKVMDDRKFKRVFSDFQFTPFIEGLKNTIEYYKSIYPY